MSTDKCFLHYILSIFVNREYGPGHEVGALLMDTHKVCEGRIIPRPGPRNQLRFLIWITRESAQSLSRRTLISIGLG